MRKSLFLIALVAISFQTFANVQQTGYRWRNDDGDLDNATWAADDSTAITISSDQVIRLRVRFDNTDDASTYTVNGLKYGLKSDIDEQLADSAEVNDYGIGEENELLSDLGPYAAFDYVESSYVSDEAETTSLDVAFSGHNSQDMQSVFSAGIFMSSSQDVVIGTSSYCEIEYCIKPTEYCDTVSYYFVVAGSNLLYPGSPKFAKIPELKVELVDDNGGSSSSIVSDASQIKVYTSEDNIRILDLPQGFANVKLYNLMGSVAKTIDIEANGGTFDVSTFGLNEGIYILSIQGDAVGNFQQKILIK